MMKHAPTTTPAQLLDELPDRLDRPARREHVVVDHDARPGRDQLGMELERVLAVLEHVARADGLGRQLAGPPRRNEPDAGLDGDRGAEPEAARLGAEHEVGVALLHPLAELARRSARSVAASARSGVTSLNPTPGIGKSCTSRTMARRSTHCAKSRRSRQ